MNKKISAEEFINLEDSKGALKALKGREKEPIYPFLKAEALRIEGFFKKAVPLYLKFINVSSEKELCLEAMTKLSASFRALGEKDKSFYWAKKAVSAADGKNNSREARLELAMCYRLAGNFALAARYLSKLKSEYEKERDYAGVAYVLWSLGGIYRLQGRFPESVAAFSKALVLAEKEKDYSLKTYSLFGLAGVLRIAGSPAKSYETYMKAASFASKDDLFAKAYSYCGAANALRQKGELEKAESSYEKSLKLYSLIDDKVDLGFVYWGLGEIYKKRGEIPRALSYFLKAARFFKTGFEKRGEILTGISLSQIYYLKGNTELASKIYFGALAKAKKEKLNTYLEIFT